MEFLTEIAELSYDFNNFYAANNKELKLYSVGEGKLEISSKHSITEVTVETI